MNKWPYRPLSDFLNERVDRFSPQDPAIASYKRLDKIDFFGRIHISEKPSKTDMILVKPGDLVISGINVAKGALAVYDGADPITATIHYSSYTFDKGKIDIDFLKRFLKSPAFINELRNQVKGGIKTEIKAKHLLALKVRIPELAEQQIINHYFESIENEISGLSEEVNYQSSLLTKLRQSILQEAIEGKLTVEWRKANPVRKGDPDYDAVALLAKIKAEKQKLILEGKIKKEKPLAPIKQEDVPFALPEGWVWCRLGTIIKNPPRNGYSPKEVSYISNIRTLKLGATTWGKFDESQFKYIDETIPEDSVYWLRHNDILIQRSNSIDYVGVSAIYIGADKQFIYPDLMMKIEILQPILTQYAFLMLSSPLTRSYYRSMAKGAQKSMPKIDQTTVNQTLFALPSIAEQQAIVTRVERLLSMVDELAKQVSDRKEQVQQLMQAVLREAFKGGNHA